jgi:hypothetical protein
VTGLRLAALALLAAVAAAALAGPRLLEPAAEPAGPALPAEQAIATRASLNPSVHLFADPVTARLQVAVDRRRLDLGALSVELDFAPYQPVGRTQVERRDAGHVTYLVHTTTLRCLEPACIPERLESAAGEQETGRGERKVFELPAARITFGPGEDRDPLTVRWPALESVSRINATEYAAWAGSQALPPGAQRAEFPFTVDLVPAAPTYRVPPRAVAGAALAGALLLLLVPASAVAGWVRDRRRTPAERWALLPPLARARRAALWAAGRDDADERRRALELAAAELGRGGEEALAGLARELAWSDGPPAPEATTALATEIAEDGRG